MKLGYGTKFTHAFDLLMLFQLFTNKTSACLSILLHYVCNSRLRQLLNTQQLIISLGEQSSIVLTIDSPQNETESKRPSIRWRLLESLISLLLQILSLESLPLNLVPIAGQLQKLVLSELHLLNEDMAILSFLGMLQYSSHGSPNTSQCRTTNEDIAAIKYASRRSLEVDNKAMFQTPIKEWPGDHCGPGECAVLLADFLQFLDNCDLVTEDWQLRCERVSSVAAKFRGNESLNAGGLGCLDETKVNVSRDDADAEGVDHGIVALEGGHEGVQRVVINYLDLNA